MEQVGNQDGTSKYAGPSSTGEPERHEQEGQQDGQRQGQQKQQEQESKVADAAGDQAGAEERESNNKFVVVVNAKENKPMHNALVHVLDLKSKVVVQQFLVSRNKENQLLLRELPGLVRGIVFTTASVIQHHQNKSKLVFLFTSKRSDLQGKYLFRITAEGSFVDSKLVSTSMGAVHDLLNDDAGT
ncbi:Hypothetical Protein FCC1311_080102 [Hondaea fermentalgiana]|uniref:Uncharacterized protein n=1 Tax=Hondaea fermentalgiana TaxID=2315210 RepID=A0A2R5GMC8_9STRA|nr:Hypothetical Protein FCC1311_080102 [Hondaea fermentalgiana]|eukprot:GBG31785.1 Hypothetical Protein FCC1311_080102 [Hondaea fermentalgiana]